MLYHDLKDLVEHSSSSRRYFLSLPVPTQLSLSEYNHTIRSAAELHAHAEMIKKHCHAIENSEYYDKIFRS